MLFAIKDLFDIKEIREDVLVRLHRTRRTKGTLWRRGIGMNVIDDSQVIGLEMNEVKCVT